MGTPRRFRWGFVVLGIVLIALIAWLAQCQKPTKPKGPPPVAVTVAPVTVQDVATSISELGAAQAWQGVLINPQISGRLDLRRPRRRRRPPGRAARRDRLRTLQGGADPGRRGRCGATRRSWPAPSVTSRAIQTAADPELHRPADRGGPGSHRQAGRGHGARGPGRGRRRPGERPLLPHLLAGQRPRRRAAGRPRQRRHHAASPPASSASTRSSRSRCRSPCRRATSSGCRRSPAGSAVRWSPRR